MELALAYTLVFGLLYFTPTIVASSRKKKNIMAIGVLNFFLGWTVIGWIVSLVWACTVDEKAS